MRKVMAREQFNIDKNTYIFRLYYHDIGIIPPECDASKPGLQIPESYDSSIFELQLTKLITSSNKLQEIFNTKLSSCHAAVNWQFAAQNLGKIKIVCLLKYNTENLRELAKNWPKVIEDNLITIRNEFLCNKVEVTKALWKTFFDSASKATQEDLKKNNEQVMVTYDEICHCAWIVGLVAPAKILTSIIEKLRSEIEENYKIKQETITEKIQALKPHHIKLFVLTKFITQLETQFGVTIEVGQSNEYLSITGLPNPIREATNKIMEAIPSVVQKSFTCSERMLELIARDKQTQERLEDYMKNHDGDFAIAAWEVRNDYINVHAMDDKNGQLAFRIITENIASQTVPINELPIREVLRSENWKQLQRDVYLDQDHRVCLKYSSDFRSLAIYGLQALVLLSINQTDQEDDYKSLTYHGIKTPAVAAAELVREYLESKAIFTRSVHLPPGIAKYLKYYGSKLLEDIMKRFEQYHLRLQPIDDDNMKGVKATGGKQACEKCEMILKNLSEQQMYTDYFTVTDLKRVKFLLSDAGKVFCVQLEDRIKVVVEKYNPNFEDDEEKRNIACLVQKSKNLEIAAILYDITSLKVDAIVNAANENLWLGSGVAGAIKTRGM